MNSFDDEKKSHADWFSLWIGFIISFVLAFVCALIALIPATGLADEPFLRVLVVAFMGCYVAFGAWTIVEFVLGIIPKKYNLDEGKLAMGGYYFSLVFTIFCGQFVPDVEKWEIFAFFIIFLIISIPLINYIVGKIKSIIDND